MISTVLSLRTKDQTTAGASARLFRLATTPEAMLKVPRRTIERAIYPVGFYRTKARHIHDICRDLLTRSIVRRGTFSMASGVVASRNSRADAPAVV